MKSPEITRQALEVMKSPEITRQALEVIPFTNLEADKLALPGTKALHEGLGKRRGRHGLRLDDVIVKKHLCLVNRATLEDEGALEACERLKG